MINGNILQQMKLWVSNHPKEAGTIVLAIGLFISSFIIPIENGGYFIFVLAVIITSILIGSVFLLYNITILFMAIFFQEGLSQTEKTWVHHRMKRNFAVTMIWISAAIIVFLIPNQVLGIIASIFLTSLLLITHVAGIEENPFLEKRYEI